MSGEPATFGLARRLVAEAIGSALLLAMVVGSGIMAERLSGGNVALALLANAIATGAGLTTLILVFGPVSGAHFNPAVTLAMAVGRRIGSVEAAAYVAVQVIGAVAGVFLAHAMFAAPVLQVSIRLRAGPGQALAEFIATFGLLAIILGCERFRPGLTAGAVGLYVTSAYWFTASTSFANPAVTLARSLTASFAGIAPVSVPAFVAAQIAGGLAAILVMGWLLRPAPSAS